MGLIWLDTFDHYSTAYLDEKYTTTSGSPTISAGNGRYGTDALSMGSGVYVGKTFGAKATYTVGWSLKPSALPAAAANILMFLDGSDVQCTLKLRADGLLEAYRGNTTASLGVSTSGITAGRWYYLECTVTIDGAAGVFKVVVNHVPVLDLSSQDTNTSANAYATKVRLCGPATGASYIDDLYVRDDATMDGDGRNESVLPDGAGASTEWTASAGSNYQCVDENPPNGDTDYVSSDTPGSEDSYTFAALTTTAGTVKGVMWCALVRKTDAGARTVRPTCTIGGVVYYGDVLTVLDDYSFLTYVWAVSPATSSAWTIAEINGAAFGIEDNA